MIHIDQIAAAMDRVAKQLVEGLKAMKKAGVTVRAPEFLDFSFDVVTAFNAIERVQETNQGTRVSTVRPGVQTTTQNTEENRGNSGGTTQTQTYTYEQDS